MKNELMVISAVKEVSSAVGSILTTYREGRAIKKEQSIILQKRIQAFQAVTRTRAIGEVFKTNIEEIAKAQRLIDSMNLNDVAYDMAMQQMRILNDQLTRNLEDFSNGI